jgi:hypothetical protein
MEFIFLIVFAIFIVIWTIVFLQSVPKGYKPNTTDAFGCKTCKYHLGNFCFDNNVKTLPNYICDNYEPMR